MEKPNIKKIISKQYVFIIGLIGTIEILKLLSKLIYLRLGCNLNMIICGFIWAAGCGLFLYAYYSITNVNS